MAIAWHSIADHPCCLGFSNRSTYTIYYPVGQSKNSVRFLNHYQSTIILGYRGMGWGGGACLCVWQWHIPSSGCRTAGWGLGNWYGGLWFSWPSWLPRLPCACRFAWKTVEREVFFGEGGWCTEVVQLLIELMNLSWRQYWLNTW